MLEDFNYNQQITKDIYIEEFDRLKNEMALLQLEIKKKNLPVIVLFEGTSTAGKGHSISQTILSLDPRFFTTYSITKPNDFESRMPDMWRYWIKIPCNGQICFMDRSWYQDLFCICEKSKDAFDSRDVKKKFNSIECFERLLVSDGTLIIKIYVNISKKEQYRRLKDLSKEKSTAWRVTKKDWDKNDKFEQNMKIMDYILETTNYNFAPWYVVDGTYKRNRNIAIYKAIIDSVKNAFSNDFMDIKNKSAKFFLNAKFDLINTAKINEVNLDRFIDKIDYKNQLNKLQKELFRLQNILYCKKIPMVIVFEGWDAAGKGGVIKRVAGGLDARGYNVNPISAPTDIELNHHYLWRFWKKIPKNGHVAIYDRSWYGRVMVERIEKITPESEWERAYNEINFFEKELYENGFIVVKFWLQISKDIQLQRFRERENTPSKNWKITSEDWRNRAKWDEYNIAVDEMIEKTSTKVAPWNIVPSNDKLFSRIYVLKILIQTINEHLDKGKLKHKNKRQLKI